MRLSDKTYDILQAIQKMSLLLAAFYATIAEGLNLPYADAVQTVATALSALLLGILENARSTYRQDRLNSLNIVDEIDSDMKRDDALNIDIVSHEDIDGVG